MLGAPVYELIGGPTREKVRLYTHLGGTTPEALAEQAAACVEEGFTAVRLYPFGDFGAFDFEEGRGLENMSYTAMIRNAEQRVAAVRDAVGPDVDVMIDVVNRLTPAEAIAVGRALEPYNLYFFEDPIEPENMDAWEYVAASVPMPLAMGRATLHNLPVPRSVEPQRCCICPSGSVARRWHHKCQKNRNACRGKLRWCGASQSVELCAHRRVRTNRCSHSQSRRAGISVG